MGETFIPWWIFPFLFVFPKEHLKNIQARIIVSTWKDTGYTIASVFIMDCVAVAVYKLLSCPVMLIRRRWWVVKQTKKTTTITKQQQKQQQTSRLPGPQASRLSWNAVRMVLWVCHHLTVEHPVPSSANETHATALGYEADIMLF